MLKDFVEIVIITKSVEVEEMNGRKNTIGGLRMHKLSS
jgi:hypothetical protein